MLYNSFKEYIEINYNYLLQDAIHEYINKYHDGQGFHSYNVTSLLEQWPDNVRVMALTCHDESGPFFTMDVHVKADIVSKGLGMSFYQADRQTKWFTVFLRGTLSNGLRNVEIIGASEYSRSEYDEENGMDEYLVPYIRSDQLEDIADDFTAFCCGDEIYNGWNSPLKKMLDELELTWHEAALPPGEMGRMYFRDSEELVDKYVMEPGKKYPVRCQAKMKIEAGTILTSHDYFFINGYGSKADTLAHEIVHWDKHKKFFEILCLLDQGEKTLYCESTPAVSSPDGLEGVAKARWWAEWQANALAPRYLMPKRIFNKYFSDMLKEQRDLYGGTKGQIMERALQEIAGVFGVTKYEAKLRALQLGYKQAEGAFLRVSGYQREAYSFNPNALEERETFLLDARNGKHLYEKNPEFAELIDSGKFIYTGCVVCINDPLYVQKTDDPSCPQNYDLTDYALEHVDLCCLKFKRVYTRVEAVEEYYNLCYLSKDVNAAEFKETKEIELFSNQDAMEELRHLKEIQAEGKRVMDIKRKLPNNFAETLQMHMKRLKDENGKKMTIKCLQQRTGLSNKYISEIINGGRKPSEEVMYALCLAMHLHPIFSEDIMRKAYGGYPDNEQGAMAEYLLSHHFMESIDMVNDKLRKVGHPTWGKDVE